MFQEYRRGRFCFCALSEETEPLVLRHFVIKISNDGKHILFIFQVEILCKNHKQKAILHFIRFFPM